MQNALKAIRKNLFWIVFPLIIVAIVCLMRVFPVQVIKTDSMNPTMPAGTVLIDVPTSHIQKGDVISFRDNEGAVVTHRVFDIQKDGTILTKGDANSFVDNPVAPLKMDKVIGKVLFNQGASWVAIIMWGLIIGILVAMAYVIVRVLIKKDEREVKEEKMDELVLSD